MESEHPEHIQRQDGADLDANLNAAGSAAAAQAPPTAPAITNNKVAHRSGLTSGVSTARSRVSLGGPQARQSAAAYKARV